MSDYEREKLIAEVLKPLHGMTVRDAKTVLREAEAQLEFVKVIPYSSSSTKENSQGVKVDKPLQELYDKIILEFGEIYEKYGLTFGQVYKLLDKAKAEAEIYSRHQKFKFKR